MQYLDFAPRSHPFRRTATHLIVKIADRSNELPSSLVMDGIIRTPHPQICGGFADVHQGLYVGELVAIKMPRTLDGDELARKVSKGLL
jgi:hypothetical protein